MVEKGISRSAAMSEVRRASPELFAKTPGRLAMLTAATRNQARRGRVQDEGYAFSSAVSAGISASRAARSARASAARVNPKTTIIHA